MTEPTDALCRHVVSRGGSYAGSGCLPADIPANASLRLVVSGIEVEVGGEVFVLGCAEGAWVRQNDGAS